MIWKRYQTSFFLRFLAAGPFGNRLEWILGAMRRALEITSRFDMDVRLVSYGPPSQSILQ
jgi:hypothetical protein